MNLAHCSSCLTCFLLLDLLHHHYAVIIGFINFTDLKLLFQLQFDHFFAFLKSNQRRAIYPDFYLKKIIDKFLCLNFYISSISKYYL